jgi:phosphohistidine phosphatase SixA
MVRACLGLLLAAILGTGAPAAVATDAAALFEQLSGGGHVIYWRHATTDRSQPDRDLRDIERCEFQRNLNAQGRAEARRVGTGFAARGVPLGEIYSSDFCRNRETAELAFGRYERVPDLWNLPQAHAGSMGRDELVSRLRTRLGTPPADPSTNTVLVGHNLNLQAAAGVVIGEGEMAVFGPLGEGRFEFLGTLKPADFE